MLNSFISLHSCLFNSFTWLTRLTIVIFIHSQCVLMHHVFRIKSNIYIATSNFVWSFTSYSNYIRELMRIIVARTRLSYTYLFASGINYQVSEVSCLMSEHVVAHQIIWVQGIVLVKHKIHIWGCHHHNKVWTTKYLWPLTPPSSKIANCDHCRCHIGMLQNCSLSRSDKEVTIICMN